MDAECESSFIVGTAFSERGRDKRQPVDGLNGFDADGGSEWN